MSCKEKSHYLNEVCAQIKTKCIHEAIRMELSDHLEDQQAAYMNRGMTAEAALEKSLYEMGDPVVVGKQMNETHSPLAPWHGLVLTLVLTIAGVLMQWHFCAIAIDGQQKLQTLLWYVPLGMAVLIAAYFADYTLWERYAWHVFGGLLVLCFIGFQLIPTEFGAHTHMYPLMLLMIPATGALIHRLKGSRYIGCAILFVGWAIPAWLLLKAPTISGFVLFSVAVWLLMMAAVFNNRFEIDKRVGFGTLLGIPPLLVAMGWYLWLKPFQAARIMGMLLPSSNNPGNYYGLLLQSIFRSSPPIGDAAHTGLTASSTLVSTFPNWQESFSLTYLCAKFGVFPAAILTITMICFCAWLFSTLLDQKSSFGLDLGRASAVAITGQLMLYLLANIGRFPVDCSLPFISYGPAAYVVNMLLVGLLLSIFRRVNYAGLSCNRHVR